MKKKYRSANEILENDLPILLASARECFALDWTGSLSVKFIADDEQKRL